jgi:PKD repeat protein
VKEEEEDRMLSDLFRQKLENAEVTPSASVGTNLIHRVGRREFLRFNPGRFNIWYAGSVAIAGTALAIILSSGPEKKNRDLPKPAPIEINNEANDNKADLGLTKAAVQGTQENNLPASQERRRSSKAITETTGKNKTEAVLSNRKDIDAAAAEKVNSLPNTDILSDAEAEKNKLRINSMQNNYIGASATEGCSPLKIRFKCLAVSFDSCYWYFGDGGYSAVRDPEWLFDNAGEYKVTLQVFSSGAKYVSSVMINVHPKPIARFEITPENAVLPQDEINFHNYSEGAEKFRWDFGDGTHSDLLEPRHTYRKYGNYSVQLVASSESGCSDSLVINNAFSESGCFIQFPNAFIPNANGPSGGYYSPKSDEASQIFHPVFSGVTEYQLRIFSRRGILIFESNDINYGWDGYYKGQLSEPGVYIWKVRGNFMNGEEFTKMGDVTMLKN